MKNKKSLLLMTALFAALVVAEMYKPKPIDWKQTYSKDDKIPYGTYIFHRLLPQLFPNAQMETVTVPIYNQLGGNEAQGELYVVIDHSFSPDELDTQALLDFVERGNYALIAAESFSDYMHGDFKDSALAKELGVSIENEYQQGHIDSIGIKLLHPDLGGDTLLYKYSYYTANNIYTRYPQGDTTLVLGGNQYGKHNFIKINHGKGAFFLHSTPIAFTNYYMLHGNNGEYVEKAFSYLPATSKLYFDEYYKTGREGSRSELRYLLSTDALKWALYTTLAGLLLFILFEAKRKQRIIPVIPPVKNTTLEFSKTVGMLYYRNRDNKNMAYKKVSYLIDHIRTKYFIKKIESGPQFWEMLAAKSGAKPDLVKHLFILIDHIRSQPQISDDELLRLNRMIDEFYTQSGS